jgi:hypothetical protein
VADVEKLSDLAWRLWNDVDDRITFADEEMPETIPDFADDEWESEAELGARAQAWCRGFLRAMRAWPDAWERVLDRPELRRHVGLIVATAGESAATTLPESFSPDALPHAIGSALLAISHVFPSEDEDEPALP